jgi:hypothetical protein
MIYKSDRQKAQTFASELMRISSLFDDSVERSSLIKIANFILKQNQDIEELLSKDR